MSEPTLIIGRLREECKPIDACQQADLFAGMDAELEPWAYEPKLVIEAINFLRSDLVEVKRNGETFKGIPARRVWEWLGSPDRFGRWWRAAAEDRKLFAGKDFVCLPNSGQQKTGRGGHNKSDYILGVEAAQKLIATDESPRGEAMLRGLWFLANNYHDGDTGMLRSMLLKQTDAELLASISDWSIRRGCARKFAEGATVEQVQEWLKHRSDGKLARKDFTTALKEAGARCPRDYQRPTNIALQTLHSRTAAELRQEWDLRPYETPRNAMSLPQVLEHALTEARAAEAIRKDKLQGMPVVEGVIRTVAQRLVDSRLSA